jgi:ATP-dependent DNA ligase
MASRPTTALTPPIEPMLAKIAEEIPPAGDFLYEPKWDGFRAIVFRGGKDDVCIQSRDLRPFDRYFPDLHNAFVDQLPDGAVIDGEIVIATREGLDFDALQMRLHPAATRVEKLARETPASFVAFDALMLDGRDIRSEAQSERRQKLEAAFDGITPPIHLTPVTRDRAIAVEWLTHFEGAGLGWRDRETAEYALPAGQAGDVEDQACAHRRLRRGRISLAQNG